MGIPTKAKQFKAKKKAILSFIKWQPLDWWINEAYSNVPATRKHQRFNIKFEFEGYMPEGAEERCIGVMIKVIREWITNRVTQEELLGHIKQTFVLNGPVNQFSIYIGIGGGGPECDPIAGCVPGGSS